MFAVRQGTGLSPCVSLELQPRQDLLRFADCRAFAGNRAPPNPAASLALATGEYNRLQHREPGEQRIDLEGARHASLDARVLWERGHSFVAEIDLSGRRRKEPGQEIDERRLPRAVGPDQRVTRALFER